MVDPINARPITARTPVTGVAPVRAPQPAPERRLEAPAATAGANIAREVAGTPPVDLERVTRIKRAIAAGTFPLLPATIADRLLALRLNWDGHDEA